MTTNPRYNAIYTVASNDLSDIIYKTIDDILPGIPTVLTGKGVVQVDSGSLSLITPLGAQNDVLTTIDNFGNVGWAPSSGGGVAISADVIPKGDGSSIVDSSISIVNNPIAGIVGDVINLSQVANTSDYIGSCTVATIPTLLIGANVANDVEDRDILILNRGANPRDIKITNTTTGGFIRANADTCYLSSTTNNNVLVNSTQALLSEASNGNNVNVDNTGVTVEVPGLLNTKPIILKNNSGKVILENTASNTFIQVSDGVLVDTNLGKIEVSDALDGVYLTAKTSGNNIYVDDDEVGLYETSVGYSFKVGLSGVEVNSSYILPATANGISGQVLTTDSFNNCSFQSPPATINYLNQIISWNCFEYFNMATDLNVDYWYKTDARNSTTVVAPTNLYDFGSPSFSTQVDGTYLFSYSSFKGSDMAIIDISVDGVITSVDLYAAGTSQFFTSFTRVLTAGTHTINIIINGKNAASSNYYFAPMNQGICINRIA